MASTIIMPQLGETVAEGKILEWFKSVGDEIKIGDRLFEVETDKVTVEVEAVVAGTLTEIQTGTGATAKVGAVVAVVGSEAASKPVATAKPQSLAAYEEVKSPLENFGKAKSADGLRITPLARRVLSQGDADMGALAQFASSGNLRKIQMRDAQAFLAAASGVGPSTVAVLETPAAGVTMTPPIAPQSTPSPNLSQGNVVTLNTIRQRTGEKLAENWRTIPHVFQAIDVDFTSVEAVRSIHKERFKAEHGHALTYLPFIARAVCVALQSFPLINARFDGKALTLSSDINLGIAVDLNHNGLVVPVVHSAQDFTLPGLAKAIGRQINKARTGKMTSADMSGGTYSITNNGAFGTSFTTPIINAPQVAILSSDAIRKKPCVITTDQGDFIAPRLIGTLGQSFDHRAFDGAYAAAFLSKLKETIENKHWAEELGETP
jgi:pyruvate/2-oxoglutarate dehydrogenase complex dihydrolipoamide acyltransferase (E2) component